MTGKKKLLLTSAAALSLALAGVAVASGGAGLGVLGGESDDTKSISITFTADDFRNGDAVIYKNGNPFNVVGTVSVSGDVITFAKDAGLTRTETGTAATSGYTGANLFYEMSITGLTVATPSQAVTHAGSSRTWYKVINDRGAGDGRGLYSSSAEADAVGYTNISHTWSNNRDDNDPSAFWIETSKPDLVATGGEFSFKTLTFKYECIQAGASYQKIMCNNSLGQWKFTDEEGNTLAPIMKNGKTLKFKLDVDRSVAMRYNLSVTYSNTRNDDSATALTPDSNGVYSLVLSNEYTSGTTGDYTYLRVVATEKTSTAISTAAEFAAMTSDGIYHLTADIDLTETAALNSFSGVLDGKGYRIYQKRERRRGDNACGLFKTLTGLVRNVTVDFSFDNYAGNCGTVCSTIDGGIIEDVTAHATFMYDTNGQCGGLAATATNGALVRNSTVYFLSNAMDKNSVERIATVVGNLGANCNVDNVKVKLPMGYDTSKLEIVRSSEKKGEVTNSSIVNYEEKALDDAFYEGGEATEDTYNGMAVRKKVLTDVATGTEFLNGTYDLNSVKSASFYLKITELKQGDSADSMTDADTLYMTGTWTDSLYVTTATTGDIWNYVDIRKISDNNFLISVAPMNTTGTHYKLPWCTTRDDGNTMASFSGLYRDWKAHNSMTAYSTPLYVEK